MSGRRDSGSPSDLVVVRGCDRFIESPDVSSVSVLFPELCLPVPPVIGL